MQWPRGTGTREDRKALLRASIMELGRRPTPLLAYAEATANCTATDSCCDANAIQLRADHVVSSY